MVKSATWAVTMGQDEKTFYQELGKRVSRYRKNQDLTQQHLAEILGLAQQTVAHYEGGRLRIPASMLPTLADSLQVTIEDLLGQPGKTSRGKRGPASKLEQQLSMIALLPKAKQRFVMEFLDNVLQQAV